jgi:hypothetical protein
MCTVVKGKHGPVGDVGVGLEAVGESVARLPPDPHRHGGLEVGHIRRDAAVPHYEDFPDRRALHHQLKGLYFFCKVQLF